MKHTFARKRFKLVLITLLAACFILFIESRIEAFMPQLKASIDARIEERLGGKIRFSIGHISGGIFQPFVLNDITIKDKKDAPLFPSLVINNIRTEYRVWDLLNVKENSVFDKLLPKDSRIYINFVTKAYNIYGFVCLEGDIAEPGIKGYLNLPGRGKVEFNGFIKGDCLDIYIKNGPAAFKVQLTVSDEGVILLDFKTNHLNLNGFDVVCDGILKTRILKISEKPGDAVLEGDFETKSLILNFRPFMNIKTSFIYSNGVLEMPDIVLGEGFKANAKIGLQKPFTLDAVVTANHISLGWLLMSIGAKDATSIISGTLNSKLEFKGLLSNPKMNISLDVRKGTLSTLDFEVLTATFKGDFPFLRIEESRITRDSGYFSLAGEMNLTRIGKNNFFDDIKIVTDDKAITWDDWEDKKALGHSEIMMKKRLNDQVNLDFKRYISEEKVGEGIGDADEVQLEYKLHPNDSLKMMIGQDKDFVGLEHKDRF